MTTTYPTDRTTPPQIGEFALQSYERMVGSRDVAYPSAGPHAQRPQRRNEASALPVRHGQHPNVVVGHLGAGLPGATGERLPQSVGQAAERSLLPAIRRSESISKKTSSRARVAASLRKFTIAVGLACMY
jgi:hypothetical protein